MVASPVHPASLVDPSLHSPALIELIEIEMGRNLIEHLVDTVVDTVDYALGRPSTSSSSATRGRSVSRNSEHAKFLSFVTDVIYKAEVKVPALLVSLVYIGRAKPHIQIALEQWANERVFLGALILANKYLNDSTLKNVHWALCTGVFGKRDIGRIEREFLDVLDFELSVSEADLLAHHDALLALSAPSHAHAHPRLAHAHHRHARRASSPFNSRWSSDSSDMDVDSESSFDSVSLPRTPEPVAAAAPAVPFPAKDAAAHVHFAAEPRAGVHEDAHHAHHHHHEQSAHRRSALSTIIRSFPIPHFHTQPPIPAHAPQAFHTLASMPVRA